MPYIMPTMAQSLDKRATKFISDHLPIVLCYLLSSLLRLMPVAFLRQTLDSILSLYALFSTRSEINFTEPQSKSCFLT